MHKALKVQHSKFPQKKMSWSWVKVENRKSFWKKVCYCHLSLSIETNFKVELSKESCKRESLPFLRKKYNSEFFFVSEEDNNKRWKFFGKAFSFVPSFVTWLISP